METQGLLKTKHKSHLSPTCYGPSRYNRSLFLHLGPNPFSPKHLSLTRLETSSGDRVLVVIRVSRRMLKMQRGQLHQLLTSTMYRCIAATPIHKYPLIPVCFRLHLLVVDPSPRLCKVSLRWIVHGDRPATGS